jgi:hypothetical protein
MPVNIQKPHEFAGSLAFHTLLTVAPRMTFRWGR